MRGTEAPEVGDELHLALLPVNLLHRRSCQHLAAELCNPLGKVSRKLVIAAAQPIVVAAPVSVLSLLLCAQRRHAHFAMIGSVEAFDISDDPAALFHRRVLAVKIL